MQQLQHRADEATLSPGLKNRYGSLIRVIAGVHFSFSMPDSFWCGGGIWWEGCCSQRFISIKYMGLIATSTASAGWCPYLFGASPAICDSFLKGAKQPAVPETGKGTLYLPMQPPCLSDLGYPTAPRRGSRSIAVSLPAYVGSLRQAINTHDPDYAGIGSG